MAASTASVPEFKKNVQRMAADRRDLRERLAERDLRLVIIVGGDVQESRGLVPYGPNDLRVRMNRRSYRDAGAEVQIDIAVDVFNDGALATRHDERSAARIGRRHNRAIAFDDRPRAWARRRDFDVWNRHVAEAGRRRELKASFFLLL